MTVLLEENREVLEPTLDVLRSVAHALIKAELIEIARREDVHRGIRDASKMGASVNDLSEATGLRVDEVRSIISKPVATDLEIAELIGA